LYCNKDVNKCYEPEEKLGEACGDDIYVMCRPPSPYRHYKCIDKKCVEEKEIGGICGQENVMCMSGLECIDGRCA
jgi:hypothetical protein